MAFSCLLFGHVFVRIGKYLVCEDCGKRVQVARCRHV